MSFDFSFPFASFTLVVSLSCADSYNRRGFEPPPASVWPAGRASAQDLKRFTKLRSGFFPPADGDQHASVAPQTLARQWILLIQSALRTRHGSLIQGFRLFELLILLEPKRDNAIGAEFPTTAPQGLPEHGFRLLRTSEVFHGFSESLQQTRPDHGLIRELRCDRDVRTLKDVLLPSVESQRGKVRALRQLFEVRDDRIDFIGRHGCLRVVHERRPHRIEQRGPQPGADLRHDAKMLAPVSRLVS